MANIGKAANRSAYMRQELKDITPLYRVVDDALLGSVAVKRATSRYLPVPNATDVSAENKARYDAYITRAVYYAVTRRTMVGFIGELFDKDPVITIPPAMDAVIEDATGEGVGILQLAKQVAGYVISKGRSGLFVDYPATEGATTKADLEDGTVRPIIRAYHPLKIINWRYKKVGALNKLSLIVLEEEYDKADNGFTLTKGKQWRVLRLDAANEYTQEIYRDTSGEQTVNERGELAPPTKPVDADGKPFRDIPFTFVGSETNDANVDYPPLFDLADINIAHYRNSADFEEACYLVGQPTPVITGLTQDWADRYFKTGIALGSRAAIPLPQGATAELLQASETNMTKDAMEGKERQMVALGAKLVEQKQVQRTATESSMETASQQSALATIADNVSMAFEWALGYAAMFAGVSEQDIVFKLNKQFSISFLSPEARAEAISAWQAEAISFTEMRSALRKGGTATLPDEQARAEIKEDIANGNAPIDTSLPGNDPNADPANDPTIIQGVE
jgi:hypothetical protein